jgi:hypothetical protein
MERCLPLMSGPFRLVFRLMRTVRDAISTLPQMESPSSACFESIPPVTTIDVPYSVIEAHMGGLDLAGATAACARQKDGLPHRSESTNV